jgi:hypothetical protein
VGWNSEAYLETLEQDLREALESAGPEAHTVVAGAVAGSR